MILKNISACYGEKKVIDNFSFSASGAKNIMLAGKSGSGKTTLLHLMCGLILPKSGEIIAPQRMGVVFQEDRLVEHISCIKNCEIIGAGEKNIGEIFAELGIADCAERLPRNISGGQRRRVAIARALSFEAECILLDEPFAGLDSIAKQRAIDCILKRTKNKLVIFASHNRKDASELNAEIIEI